MTEERKLIFTGMTGRFDVPSFTLTENSDLKITIDFSKLKSKSGLFRLFVIHGGAPGYTFAFTQKEPIITLSSEWLKRGGTEYIEFSMKQYNDTGTILVNGGYAIEPLSVTTEEGCFVVTSVIQGLIDKVDALRTELTEAMRNHEDRVSSCLGGFDERTAMSFSRLKEETEAFKSEMSGRLEEYRSQEAEQREAFNGEVAGRLEEMDGKLSEVLSELQEEKAVKEEILAKFTDYIDNGAELFPEELK